MVPSPAVMFLIKYKYVIGLIAHVELFDSKPTSIPMVSGGQLSKSEGICLDSELATQYRSVIGALQYCYISRKQLAFCVSQLC